jgi:hypothetical protein
VDRVETAKGRFTVKILKSDLPTVLACFVLSCQHRQFVEVGHQRIDDGIVIHGHRQTSLAPLERYWKLIAG